MSTKTRVAVEVGGTFTDFIWIDAHSRVHTHKVLSTPADPSEGLISGLQEALEGDVSQVSHLLHGSTVATNVIIERKGCRAALLVTRGFRDVLALQRVADEHSREVFGANLVTNYENTFRNENPAYRYPPLAFSRDTLVYETTGARALSRIPLGLIVLG